MSIRYRAVHDECGFTSVCRSEPMAWNALRKHSCERWQKKADLRARGEARRATVDRTPQPCLHKEAQHRHGTYACYVLDQCRCEPCSAANAEYERNRTRQQAYGRWNGLTDAEPARQHIHHLMSQGMGLKRIGAVSGVSHGQLWKLIYGKRRPDGTQARSRRIKPEVAERILAVELDLAGGALVPPTGAVRRLQALVAIGWSQSKLASKLGILPGNFTDLIHGRRPAIRLSTDEAVRALYDELSMQLAPTAEWRDKIAASRSRSYAKAQGWRPPLAWDDEQLDDPEPVEAGDASPTSPPETDVDEAAVYRRIHGERVPVTAAERAEVVRRLRAEGISDAQIERRTGINTHRIDRTSEIAS